MDVIVGIHVRSVFIGYPGKDAHVGSIRVDNHCPGVRIAAIVEDGLLANAVEVVDVAGHIPRIEPVLTAVANVGRIEIAGKPAHRPWTSSCIPEVFGA
jgi:hypothetical protein